MEKLIVVNSGSVSKKYALYQGEKLILSFHFEENIESDKNDYLLHLTKGNSFSKEVLISANQYKEAFAFVVDFLIDNSYLSDKSEIKSVVFRVVAPGAYFTFDRVIDEEFLDKLSEIKNQSPLHIEKMQKEFNQVIDVLKDTKMLAISDSRFHKNMPKVASIYALPKKMTENLEIKRFGYHGISVSSIVDKIQQEKKNVPEKMIICHLGGGSSVTALKNGETIENTMGYSPLEGIPMSTRIGNIDFGAVFSIADKLDLEMSELRDLMYNNSGMKGISGYSDDIRDLLSEKETGNESAVMALEKYTYEIKKVIGSYITILGGLDLLVFTGTIGERSAPIRKMICTGLSFLGLELDENNNKMTFDSSGYINRPSSEIPIEVIYTNEVGEMVKRAINLV